MVSAEVSTVSECACASADGEDYRPARGFRSGTESLPLG